MLEPALLEPALPTSFALEPALPTSFALEPALPTSFALEPFRTCFNCFAYTAKGCNIFSRVVLKVKIYNFIIIMVDFKPEEIEIISLNDTPVINLNKSDRRSTSAVNFGGGIELLMNEKRKNDGTTTPPGDIDLGDLTELENELNDLSKDIEQEPRNLRMNSKSDLFKQAFNSGSANVMKLNSHDDEDDNIKLNIDDDYNNNNNPSINIGKATSSAAGGTGDQKTWDGFSKFNNIPVNPDKHMSDKPRMTAEELLLEKFKILRKLEALEAKGAKLTKKYTMDSSLAEMQGEYELIISEKEQSNSCKFQGRMLMAAVTGMEYLNNRFDPFDVKLDGWAEQLNENIDDYDEIFGELHEKYKSKAKMAPELKLLFQLGGSAIMVHMSNTMFKSAMPGMDEIMRQNPELAQQFTQAAVNTMGQTNPGFSNFMGNFMPGSNNSNNSNNMPPPNTMRGPPPPPVQTQATKSQRTAMPNNRPDLSRARQDDGINIEENFGPFGKEPVERSSRQQQPPSQNARPEMKGPTDISDLLSGLKTKTVSMNNNNNNNYSPSAAPQKNTSIDLNNFNESTMSIKRPASAKPIKRKQKSDKNTVSLDF